MKMLAELVLLSALLNFGTAQQSGCTSQEQISYVTGTLGTICGLSLAQVDTSGSGSTFIQPLENITARSGPLNTICTAECGGDISRWLDICCSDTVGSLGLVGWCTPTGNDTAGRDRCYFAFPPIFNATEGFESLEACLTVTTSCNAQCQQALNGLVEAIGCCYQSFYNNTGFLQTSLDNGLITAEQFTLLTQNLSIPALWDVCQVDIPGVCTGDPFPSATTAAPTNIAALCPGATAITTAATTTAATTTAATTTAATTTAAPTATTTLGAEKVVPFVSLIMMAVLSLSLLFIN